MAGEVGDAARATRSVEVGGRGEQPVLRLSELPREQGGVGERTFHGFWAYQGAEAQLQSIQFLKNVSIGGGLLTVLGAGPGVLSLDARRSRRHARAVVHAPAAA